MRKHVKILAVFGMLLLMGAGFAAGRYTAGQEALQSRQQRCRTLIAFAIDKAESDGMRDPDTREALVSNLYAAYQFCDGPAAGQLHDMWNTLIFEPEAYLGREDSLAESLTGIAASLEAAP